MAGDTPLLRAAAEGHKEACAVLLEAAEPCEPESLCGDFLHAIITGAASEIIEGDRYGCEMNQVSYQKAKRCFVPPLSSVCSFRNGEMVASASNRPSARDTAGVV